MGKETERRSEMEYGRHFGRTAVKMGFIDMQQVQEALEEQRIYNTYMRSGRNKLIGEILFENGRMTFRQIDKVLNALSDYRGNVPL